MGFVERREVAGGATRRGLARGQCPTTVWLNPCELAVLNGRVISEPQRSMSAASLPGMSQRTDVASDAAAAARAHA